MCYQAFNIARERIDEINRERSAKPQATITDIDETILHNSPYQPHQLLSGKDYDPVIWKEWTHHENEREGTFNNLKILNYSNAHNKHLFIKGNTSSKDPVKNSTADNPTIVLLMVII